MYIAFAVIKRLDVVRITEYFFKPKAILGILNNIGQALLYKKMGNFKILAKSLKANPGANHSTEISFKLIWAVCMVHTVEFCTFTQVRQSNFAPIHMCELCTLLMDENSIN